ncbi:MAG: hypothetical protein LLF83_00855 [Methanobacterium sp.]|nr:hypothetical protein [Methanobacterium sp.]
MNEYVDFKKELPFVEKALHERILSPLEELESFCDKAKKEKLWNPWCLIEGQVKSLGSTRKGGSIIDIDFNGELLTIFFSREPELDLIVGADGYFFVNPFRNDKGELVLLGLGYWVPDHQRATNNDTDLDPEETILFIKK